ncbi:hypothetical protein HHK36_022458 [Tetracentron sinense]|uniref:RRM domain-containing protein n=1 Tax=Tetracentron sinense TaxID=13715 RepID=A0A835D6T5_TETSI|nr:hypothetical protein HHK36_022458 [Tetracentron sinense]
MDSNRENKIFVGGMAWWTSEEKLRKYFENYGVVLQARIIRKTNTGRSKGFGFVFFADPSVFHRVLQDTHIIEGRTVVVQRALLSEEQLNSFRYGNLNVGRSFEAGGNIKTNKIFVGWLPHTLTEEEEFGQYFQTYGCVTDVVIMRDWITQIPHGFRFIFFHSEDAVDRVLLKSFHELDGKFVEVKRALPKDGHGGNYEGYGASSAHTSTYEGLMDSYRYMQPQTTGGGFLVYGSSVNVAPGYAYGVTNSGVCYGGYGVSGYGSSSDGYSDPVGAYGNSNAPDASYVSDPSGVLRSICSNQIPSGYGRVGYGNTTSRIAPGFGGVAGISGSISSTTGQSPIGASGDGSQVYQDAVRMSNYVHAAGNYGTAQASGSQILGQQNNSSFWKWLASLNPTDLE